jgi:hypothetical protein
MSYVNRTAIVVRTKAPYTTWANGLDMGGVQHTGVSRSVYMVPEEPDPADPMGVVRAHFHEIFDHELFAWSEDRMKWPKLRTWGMFRQWFEAEVIDVVCELDGVKPEDA